MIGLATAAILLQGCSKGSQAAPVTATVTSTLTLPPATQSVTLPPVTEQAPTTDSPQAPDAPSKGAADNPWSNDSEQVEGSPAP